MLKSWGKSWIIFGPKVVGLLSQPLRQTGKINFWAKKVPKVPKVSKIEGLTARKSVQNERFRKVKKMTSKSAPKKPSKIGKSGFWQKWAESRFLQAGIGLNPVLGLFKIGAKSTCHDPSEPSDAACHCIANFWAGFWVMPTALFGGCTAGISTVGVARKLFGQKWQTREREKTGRKLLRAVTQKSGYFSLWRYIAHFWAKPAATSGKLFRHNFRTTFHKDFSDPNSIKPSKYRVVRASRRKDEEVLHIESENGDVW